MINVRLQYTKQEKGITLIALIITIIVLLILAVVSINLIKNQGIIKYAESAAEKYNQNQKDEQEKILQAEYEMAKYTGQTTGTFTDYILETKYSGAKIGDYVNYDEKTGYSYTPDTTKGFGGGVGEKDTTTGKYPLESKTYTTENLNWRILGVSDSGELELISDNPIKEYLYVANEEAYLNLEEVLNEFCDKLYGNGENAQGARSLNVEDINKIANYDPSTYNQGTELEYGFSVAYRFPVTGNYLQYKLIKNGENENVDRRWTDILSEDFQTFRLPGETEVLSSSNRSDEGIIVKNTYYNYDLSDYIDETTVSGQSLIDMLVKGTESRGINQFLASRYIGGTWPFTSFGFWRLREFEDVGGSATYYSYGTNASDRYRVRPVVTLQSDIQLTGSSESGWTIN